MAMASMLQQTVNALTMGGVLSRSRSTIAWDLGRNTRGRPPCGSNASQLACA